MGMELIERLNAAIDEEERLAVAAEGDALFDGTGIIDGAYVEGTRRTVLPSHLAAYLARHDPARVLRQVGAHRTILANHPIQTRTSGEATEYGCDCHIDWHDQGWIWERTIDCDVVLPLATIYNITPE